MRQNAVFLSKTVEVVGYAINLCLDADQFRFNGGRIETAHTTAQGRR